jgi:hypothetical protein
MSLLRRLENIEKQVNTSNAFPVVFIEPHSQPRKENGVVLVVQSEKELDNYKHQINDNTVIFLNDIDRVKEALV